MDKEVSNDITIPKYLAKEFMEWASKRSWCNSGQHIVDRLADYIERKLK